MQGIKKQCNAIRLIPDVDTIKLQLTKIIFRKTLKLTIKNSNFVKKRDIAEEFLN